MSGTTKVGRIEGSLSLAFSAVFWLPLAMAWFGMSPSFAIPLPVIYVAWIAAFVLAVIAGIRGSRLWFLASLVPVAAVLMFIRMIQG